jgi:hypothetical protein
LDLGFASALALVALGPLDAAGKEPGEIRRLLSEASSAVGAVPVGEAGGVVNV